MSDDGRVAAVGGEKDIFLTINGMKIAKRENHQWISLVPGYKVRDYGDLDRISIEIDPHGRTRPTPRPAVVPDAERLQSGTETAAAGCMAPLLAARPRRQGSVDGRARDRG